jgi:uncharacterized membrane protein
MSVLLLVGIFILAVPFLLIFGFFHVVSLSFERLGLSPETAILLIILILFGSLINIPLSRYRLLEVQERYFFRLMSRPKMKMQGLSINVGGAIIPLLLAFYFLSFVPIKEAALATGIMIIISWRMAKVVKGKGIVIPALLLSLIVAIISFFISDHHSGPIAFVSGVLGVIIGADLFNLSKVQREASGVMSIGGAGVFDGIFLIAIFSALLTSL